MHIETRISPFLLTIFQVKALVGNSEGIKNYLAIILRPNKVKQLKL